MSRKEGEESLYPGRKKLLEIAVAGALSVKGTKDGIKARDLKAASYAETVHKWISYRDTNQKIDSYCRILE